MKVHRHPPRIAVAVVLHPVPPERYRLSDHSLVERAQRQVSPLLRLDAIEAEQASEDHAQTGVDAMRAIMLVRPSRIPATGCRRRKVVPARWTTSTGTPSPPPPFQPATGTPRGREKEED